MHLFDCLLDFIFNEERSMKLLIAHLVSISKRPNLLDLDLFADVPHGKTKQSAVCTLLLESSHHYRYFTAVRLRAQTIANGSA